ncbi:AraC family transcriptional regulator [Shewanella amazonensis]|uniref:Transcriptional regulator, AraC family n=1 Tax=Shewanella amazonensis (strain ATCC BAA-1098 / SB2B) TaxID=326297 RepID=A1S5V2_SHEAM|nr:AraC family transcriptional regulator [Shewanella amazonensis]ABL99758.1 transcriptional regulator, AraC family [Shewanella amazonensis SB2B]
MQQEIIDFRQSQSLAGAELSRASYQRFDFGRHVHEDLHLGAVIRGAQAFNHKGTGHTLCRGDLSTLSPDECHDGIAATDTGYEVLVLSLPQWHLDRFAAELGISFGGFCQPKRKDMALYQAFVSLHRLLYQAENPLLEETALLDFFQRLLGQCSKSEKVTNTGTVKAGLSREIRLAKSLMADTPEPVTLELLGDATGLGRYRLLRHFRAQTGLSPHQWQLRLRLERAKKSLMQNDGNSLTDIAHQHGFSDLSHFTRHFRMAFLTSPSAYRRAIRN